MEQRIINSLSIALDAAFPEIPVLDVETEQDVDRPAFFISCISAVLTERIAPADFFMTYSFDLLFDPGVRDPEIACRRVESELMLLLRRFEDCESKYAFRPYDIHFETVDGVLHALFQITESIKLEKTKDPVVERYKLNSKAEIV